MLQGTRRLRVTARQQERKAMEVERVIGMLQEELFSPQKNSYVDALAPDVPLFGDRVF